MLLFVSPVLTCASKHVGRTSGFQHLCTYPDDRELQEEGIREHLTLTEDVEDEILLQTLACFVLVETSTRAHSFCSRYDFGPWPLLSKFSPQQIRANVSEAFMSTRAVMMNGFVFDELSSEVVTSLATSSHESGASIFFDPGVGLLVTKLFWACPCGRYVSNARQLAKRRRHRPYACSYSRKCILIVSILHLRGHQSW